MTGDGICPGGKDRVDSPLTGCASSVSRDMLIKGAATNVTIGINLFK